MRFCSVIFWLNTHLDNNKFCYIQYLPLCISDIFCSRTRDHSFCKVCPDTYGVALGVKSVKAVSGSTTLVQTEI